MAAEEMLSYYIKAFDQASPIFRAFGGQVEATNRQVQASLLEMNRTLAAQAAETSKLGEAQARTGRTVVSTAAQSEQAQQRAAVAAKQYALAAESAQIRVDTLSKKVRAGTGDQQKLNAELQLAQGRLDLAKMKMAGYASATEAGTVATAGSSRAFKEAQPALAGFAGQLGPVGGKLQTLTSQHRLLRSQGVDYLAAGLAGGAAALVAYGIKAAGTFDTLGKSIQAQTGASSKMSAQLLADVKKVATESPAAYKDIAAAVAAEYRIFGSNNKAIQQNTELFVAFADKAGTQVVPTITKVNQVLKLFHPAGMDAVGVMDQMVNLANKTQQPLGGYLQILSRFGPSLQAMGLSYTQVIGLMESFAKAGISTQGMARGLTTILTKASAEMKTQASLASNGAAKLHAYGLAVDTAQIKVNELNTKIASGKGNQQLYNDQLTVAQGKLDAAKAKYDAMATAVHNAGTQHLTLTGIVGKELVTVETAKTKADALNLSVQMFGGRLGPQMADALWHNKAALDGMQKSLGTAQGSTDKLAQAQRTGLHAQMVILGHDFTNIAASVGQVAIPPLKDLAGVLQDVAKFVAGLPKPLLDALVFGAGGLGASALLLRHTPLGGMVAKATGAEGGVAALLTGKSGTGQAIAGIGPGGAAGISGVFGFVRPGSAMNPIMVRVEGGGLGGGGLPGSLGAPPGEARSPGGVILPPGASKGVAPVEEAVVSRSATIVGGLMKGGMIAMGGTLAAQLAGSLIGGHVGQRVSSIGSTAAMGAGLGSLAGPAGTVIGGTIGLAVGGIMGGSSDTKTAMDKMDASIKAAASAGNVAQLANLGKAATEMGKKLKGLGIDGSQAFTDLGNRTSAAAAQLAKNWGANAIVPKAMAAVRGDFAITAKGAGGSLAQIEAYVQLSTGMIKSTLPQGSAMAGQALAQNFQIAAADVQKSMQAGVVSTQQGLKMIAQLMAQAFQSLGISPGTAKKLASEGWSVQQVQGAMQSASQAGFGQGAGQFVYATGGRVPGSVSGDSWTLLDPSGRAAGKVGGAELLIANRHTEAALSAATMAVYGKTAGQMVAGETRAHSAPGYATGGWVQTGATIDTAGGYGYSEAQFAQHQADGPSRYNAGMSYAELLVAGANAGMHPNVGDLLGTSVGPGTPLLFRVPGGQRIAQGVRSDVGSGQAGNAHFTVDLHQALASAIGWTPNGDIQVALPGTVPSAKVIFGPGGAAASVASAASVPVIKVPKWTGPGGLIRTLGRAVLSQVTAAANRNLRQAAAAVAPAGGGGGGGGGVVSPSGTAPTGGGFDPRSLAPWPTLYPPHEIASWILPEVQYARDHGWKGIVTSGYRPGHDPNAPSGSEHALDIYPGGAIDFGGMVDPVGAANRAAFIAATAGYSGPKLLTPIGFRDDGHMSGTGHARGGRLSYAGAFGGGGAVTAHGPTMAVFGERGDETALFIPHAQMGGVFGSDVVGAHTYPTTPTSPKGGKPHSGYNALTGQVETHTPQEWTAIHAQVAQQRRADAAARKARAAFLAGHVTDVLQVAGQQVGSFELTRKTAQQEHLPMGGDLSLMGNLSGLDTAGFRRVEAALKSGVGNLSAGQAVHAANAMAAGLGKGPDAHLVRQQGELTRKLDQLRESATKREQQAERLHKEAMQASGTQRKHLLDRAHNDHTEAQALRKEANGTAHRLEGVEGKIAASRPAQIENTIIAGALKAVASAFTLQQSQFDKGTNIAQMLEALPAGSTAHSLRLSKAQLKASGLTGSQVKALAGADPAAAYAQQVGYLTHHELPAYEQDAKRLQRLYADALKTHSKKLQDSLLNQLDAVTQAELKARGDAQTALIGKIDAEVQKAADKASDMQSSSDLLGMIQNLAPGTNLAALGLSPQALKSLGINSAQAGGLEGSSLAYLQNLQSQQGGHLTPQQMAAAQQGVAAQNVLLSSQRATDIGELNKLESQLPHLKGTARTDAERHIQDLAKSILGLTDTMSQNNDALTKLTAATNANTDATGQMTGSVSYSYQGQNYVVGGGSMTSDSPANVSLGI